MFFRIISENEEEKRNQIRKYLVATSARDCSLFVSFNQCDFDPPSFTTTKTETKTKTETETTTETETETETTTLNGWFLAYSFVFFIFENIREKID